MIVLWTATAGVLRIHVESAGIATHDIVAPLCHGTHVRTLVPSSAGAFAAELSGPAGQWVSLFEPIDERRLFERPLAAHQLVRESATGTVLVQDWSGRVIDVGTALGAGARSYLLVRRRQEHEIEALVRDQGDGGAVVLRDASGVVVQRWHRGDVVHGAWSRVLRRRRRVRISPSDVCDIGVGEQRIGGILVWGDWDRADALYRVDASARTTRIGWLRRPGRIAAVVGAEVVVLEHEKDGQKESALLCSYDLTRTSQRFRALEPDFAHEVAPGRRDLVWSAGATIGLDRTSVLNLREERVVDFIEVGARSLQALQTIVVPSFEHRVQGFGFVDLRLARSKAR